MKNKLIIFDFAGTLVAMRPAKLLISRHLLIELSKEYALGIITGGPKTEVSNILKRLEIDKFFPKENIITKNDTVYRKPNQHLIFMLTKRLDAIKVVYVGDAKKDFLMAQAANIQFIYIGKKKYGCMQISSLNELSLRLFANILKEVHDLNH